jgi:immunoglobulin-like protein involved in spore germination
VRREAVTVAIVVTAWMLPLASCATDEGQSPSPPTSSTASPMSPSSPSAPTTPTPTPTPTSTVGLEQPAVWPSAGVVFDTPAAASADFVTHALGVPATLGAFQQGDSRSGEVPVMFAGEGANATSVQRGLLLLRQLGSANGWYVIAAVNDNAAITSPAPRTTVPAGPLTVEGIGRGFEGTVIVEAFLAGQVTRLDKVVAQGGSMATPEPFTASLDLSGAVPGDVVTLLVHGGVGHELDPGDFAAIPVIVS